jgi:hypothetical protein
MTQYENKKVVLKPDVQMLIYLKMKKPEIDVGFKFG